MEYFGPEWRSTVEPTAATRKYMARVREVAASEPYLLVAHMYTRYLGDLFGGRIRWHGGAASTLTQAAVLRFTFDEIPAAEIKHFIEEWYTELNKLDLTEEQKQEIVDEGNLVFALNIELFEELGEPNQGCASSRAVP